MLGLTLREDSECHRCGGALIETTDYQWKWSPSPPTVCFRCVALSASAHEYDKHPQSAGLIHQVTKTPRPMPGRR